MRFTKRTYRKTRDRLVVRALAHQYNGYLKLYFQTLDTLKALGNRARREKRMWL